MIASLVLTGALVVAQAAPVGQLTGQVLDAENHPLTEARVTLMPVIPRGSPPGFGMPPQQTTTDQSGEYTFINPKPGEYRIQAQKAGYATEPPARGTPLPPTVTVTGGDVSAPPIVLLLGGAISGRVLDLSGQPFTDGRVMALRRVGPRGLLAPVGASAQTNDLGEFRVFGLVPGDYYIQVGPPPAMGPPGVAQQARSTMVAPTYYPGTTDQSAAGSVTVSAGATTGGLLIQMTVTSVFRVSGVVLDDAGAPVANAMVLVQPGQGRGAPPPMLALGPLPRVSTDASGAFVVPNLRPGAYVFVAALPTVVSASASAASGLGVISSTSVGPRSGIMMTQSSNGVTTEYRGDPSMGMPVAVDRDNIDNVRLVVQRPQ
jgi:hypothetical protein